MPGPAQAHPGFFLQKSQKTPRKHRITIFSDVPMDTTTPPMQDVKNRSHSTSRKLQMRPEECERVNVLCARYNGKRRRQVRTPYRRTPTHQQERAEIPRTQISGTRLTNKDGSCYGPLPSKFSTHSTRWIPKRWRSTFRTQSSSTARKARFGGSLHSTEGRGS